MNVKLFLFCSLTLLTGFYAAGEDNDGEDSNIEDSNGEDSNGEYSTGEDEAFDYLVHLVEARNDEATSEVTSAADNGIESTTNSTNSTSTNLTPSESGLSQPSGSVTIPAPTRYVDAAAKKCQRDVCEHCKTKTCPEFCSRLETKLQYKCLQKCDGIRCAIQIPYVGSTGSASELEDENKKKSKSNADLEKYRAHYIDGISNEALDAQNLEQAFQCIAEERDKEGTVSGRRKKSWKNISTNSFNTANGGNTTTENEVAATPKNTDGKINVKKCESNVIEHCKTTTCPKLCDAIENQTLKEECKTQCDTACVVKGDRSKIAALQKHRYGVLDSQIDHQLTKCIAEMRNDKDGVEWKSFECPKYIAACKTQEPIKLAPSEFL